MTFVENRHPRDRLGEFARANAASEYDRVLKTQRALERTKAAVRDPKSGAIFTGLTHADAFKRAPPEVQARLREFAVGGNLERTSHAGFVDEDGNWISRYEASKRFGNAGAGRATAESLNALRHDPHDIIQQFHAQDAKREQEAFLALDKALSTRTYDSVGRLHLEDTPISKAAVNEYVGKEIPRWRELGLDPNRIYRLLRDPEELRKAVPTFNGLQILREHVPVTADQPRPDLVVGSTGTHAKYEHPFLRNKLSVWPRKLGIDGIENDTKRALSSAYSYDADMTPGTFEGQPYDGVMRNIKGNHLALVREGRAGPDIVVGDSASELLWARLEAAIRGL